MALRDLSVRINADTNGFQRGLKQVQAGVKGFSKSMLAMSGVAAGLAGAIALAQKSFNNFLSLQSSITRVNDMFKDSAKYVKYFAETTAQSLGMSESVAYQYASTYGNIFKNLTKDSQENAKLTIAMLKASAVIASKTSFSMDTVMDKLRSGIMGATQAIDDLGVNVKIKMLEMTDAFKRISNGRSWDKLTFEEQQQIRMLGILEQAHKTYGDTVQKGGVYSMSLMKGAFKDLTTYAGAFIYSALKPLIGLLTQLAFRATSALKSLAALFGLEVDLSGMDGVGEATGGIVDDVENLNEGLDKTKKKMQKLAGFDQINLLPSDSGTDSTGTSGTSSGAGGSVFDSLAMPEFEDNGFSKGLDGMRDKVEKLKKTFIEFGKKVKEAWKTLKENAIEPTAKAFSTSFMGLVDKAKGRWGELKGEFADTKVWDDLMVVWNLMTKVWGWWGEKVAEVWGFVAGLGMDLSFNKLTFVLKQLEDAIGLVADLIRGDFSGAWEHFKNLMISNKIELVKDNLNTLKEKATEVGAWLAEKFSNAYNAIKEKTKTWWNDHVAPWFTKEKWDNLLATIGEAMGIAIGKFIAFWVVDVPAWWSDKVAPWFTKKKWQDLFNNFVEAFKTKFNEFKESFTQKVSDWWENTVKPWFTKEKWQELGTNMKEGIIGGFKAVVYKIVDIINSVKTSVSSFINGIIDGYNKVAGITPGLKTLPPFSIPPTKYPQLATGAIATGPTIAMIGEAGKEAVLPLENNTGWMDTLAKKISGSGRETTVHLSVYLDDGTLIDEFTKRISRNGQRFDRLAQGV